MSCLVDDFITDIRKALNECAETTGCSCGARYENDDILRAINDAIGLIAGLRMDEFTSLVEIEVGPGCVVNVCELDNCDKFLDLNYTVGDECYVPKEVCEIGTSNIFTNPCWEFESDSLNDNTVITFTPIDPKNPCVLRIDREDDESTSTLNVTCFNYPDFLEEGGTIPEVLCRKYKIVLFNLAMYLLLLRDHVDTQAYIALVNMYQSVANSTMSDIMTADGLFYENGKFLGRVTKAGECESES